MQTDSYILKKQIEFNTLKYIRSAQYTTRLGKMQMISPFLDDTRKVQEFLFNALSHTNTSLNAEFF